MRDDISRQAPGMRSQHLRPTATSKMNIRSLELGKSKFAELRPSHVLRSSDTPRNVSFGNIKLALDCVQHVIPRQPFQSTQDFVEAESYAIVSDSLEQYLVMELLLSLRTSSSGVSCQLHSKSCFQL